MDGKSRLTVLWPQLLCFWSPSDGHQTDCTVNHLSAAVPHYIFITLCAVLWQENDQHQQTWQWGKNKCCFFIFFFKLVHKDGAGNDAWPCQMVHTDTYGLFIRSARSFPDLSELNILPWKIASLTYQRVCNLWPLWPGWDMVECQLANE